VASRIPSSVYLCNSASADNFARDLVLQFEDVVERAVEAVRPNMRSGRRIDQLACDAHTAHGFAHTAFEDVAHAELAPDLAQVG
jgi:hypothetical protein